ncbi:hypothetical protein QQF64_031178 [Cirrhinus molitorella]|uniref:Ribonuclease A-domain domain-containing protein n=1 Tax=Cirrhinus molitorella TaxID=172907 RepID=A0ABR3N5H4_9TELE
MSNEHLGHFSEAQTQQGSFICRSSRTAHRMSLAVFLLLLIPLVFTNGWDNGRFGNDRPCQRSQNNNAYNNFKHRHILAYDFNTSSRRAWGDYLTNQRLCGRTPRQSFLHNNYQSSIKRICNGRGVRVTGNKCSSERRFKVYTVHSGFRNGVCEVNLQTERSYVIVACEVIENHCLPVHYVTQTSRGPSQNGEICRP